MARFNVSNLPTLGQSLPGLQGARSGQDLMRAYLQNQASQQSNQAAPGMNQAKMAQMLAQTQGQNIQNEQAPEMLDIRRKAVKNASIGADLRQQYIDLQMKKLPYFMATGSARIANLPAGKAALGEDPSLMSDLRMGQKGLASQFAQTAGAPGQQQPQQQFPGEQQGGMPGQQPPWQQPPPQQQQQGMNQGFGEPQAQSAPIRDEVVAAMQNATKDKLVKDLTDMQTRNQKRFSTVLNSIVGKREKDLPRLFNKFVGATNKPKYLMGLKSGDSDALAFRSFMKTDIPQIANELKRTMGGQATDQETKLMESIVNPDWWFGDGRQAISQWNSFIENNKLIEKGLDVPLRDLFKKDDMHDALSLKLAGNAQPPSVNAAPSGTVEMIDEQGNSYAVPHADMNAAMQHGWRRGNG